MQAGEIYARLAGRCDDDSADGLLVLLVRCGEGQRLLDLRVLNHRLLDLKRRYRLSAAVDDFFGASRDVQVALSVQMTHVACIEPARNAVDSEKGFIVRVAVVFIATYQSRAPNNDWNKSKNKFVRICKTSIKDYQSMVRHVLKYFP